MSEQGSIFFIARSLDSTRRWVFHRVWRVAAGVVCLLALMGPEVVGDELVRIACVGNSITEGGYPEVLQELLGTGCEVVNCGKNSKAVARNCDEPYNRTEEFERVFIVQPDHITIMLGTNDTRPPMWPCRDEFRDDLTWLVDTFSTIATNPHIWLCLPPPATDNNQFVIYGSRIVDAIIPDIRAVAQSRDLPLIDVHTPFLDVTHEDYFPDGVHPNSTGTNEIAHIFYEALAPATSTRVAATLLRAAPPSPSPRIRFHPEQAGIRIELPATPSIMVDCRGRAVQAAGAKRARSLY
jgi:alpha-L-fucosidase 2